MKKKPLSATWQEWDEWEAEARVSSPIRYWLTETVPTFFGRLRYKCHNALWWVRHRIDPRHRYHVVHTGLKPGYYDKDYLILHSCFNLLKDYVEVEKPFEHFVTDEETKPIWDEVKALYNWWTILRPSRKEIACPSDLLEHGIGYSSPESSKWALDHADQEQKWNDEDDAMLIRLIKVRHHLWT